MPQSNTFTVDDRRTLQKVKEDLTLQIAITQSVIERLDRLEDRVAVLDDVVVLKASVATSAAALTTSTADFEKRLRVLEGWRWFTLGCAAVISYIIQHLPK